MQSVDRYNILSCVRGIGFISAPSEYEQKRAPRRTPTGFTVLDLDHQTQGEFFAGTTLLAPIEEGYKREELYFPSYSCATLP